jgi:hypothetical protein
MCFCESCKFSVFYGNFVAGVYSVLVGKQASKVYPKAFSDIAKKVLVYTMPFLDDAASNSDDRVRTTRHTEPESDGGTTYCVIATITVPGRVDELLAGVLTKAPRDRDGIRSGDATHPFEIPYMCDLCANVILVEKALSIITVYTPNLNVLMGSATTQVATTQNLVRLMNGIGGECTSEHVERLANTVERASARILECRRRGIKITLVAVPKNHVCVTTLTDELVNLDNGGEGSTMNLRNSDFMARALGNTEERIFIDSAQSGLRNCILDMLTV